MVNTKTIVDLLEKVTELSTMHRVQNDLERMFSLAITNDYYVGKNPAAWKGHLENSLKKNRRHFPHPALPYKDVGRFMVALRAFVNKSRSYKQVRPTSLFAVEWIVLTAVRERAVLEAEWEEIDLPNRIWNVPWQHRKTGRVTRDIQQVPITTRMVKILEEMQRRRTDQDPKALIFRSPSPRTPATPQDAD
jgi:integrase